MATRGKKRKGSQGRGGRRPQRRKVPPDATGQELAWLQKVKQERAPLVVHLLDGLRVDGVIEFFDRDMVKVTRPDGPHLFVRKADIRYVEEA
jgi:sRNA-binding regulator protein Hfq